MADDEDKRDIDDLIVRGADIVELRHRIDQQSVAQKRGNTILPFLQGEPIPRRDFLLGTKLVRGRVMTVGGAGGLGKTTYLITTALAMATRLPLLGVMPQHFMRVLYVQLEDDLDELKRRFEAACTLHKITRREIDGRVLLFGDERLRLVGHEGRNATHPKVFAEARNQLIVTLKEHQVDVLFIDPLVRVLGTEETNAALDLLAEEVFAEATRQANCAIVCAHHTRKVTAVRGAEADELRGGSSWANASRHVEVLQRVPEADGPDKLGVDASRTRRLIYVKTAKSNHSVIADEPEVLELVSVTIPNGEQVQACRRFVPRDVGLAVITDLEAKAVLNHLRGRDWWRRDVQTKNEPRVHDAFASVLHWDIGPGTTGRANAEKIIRLWLHNEQLVEEARPDLSKIHKMPNATVKYVRVNVS